MPEGSFSKKAIKKQRRVNGKLRDVAMDNRSGNTRKYIIEGADVNLEDELCSTLLSLVVRHGKLK